MVQPTLQRVLIPGGDGLEQVIGKRAPQRGPELRQRLHRGETVQPRHERVMERGGNRQRGERATVNS